MRVLVFGANGQVGQAFAVKAPEYEAMEIIGLGRHECDIVQYGKVREAVEFYKPGIILNLTAFHDLQKCEDFPGTALKVNGHAVLAMGLLAKSQGCSMIHISTNYVFGGDKTGCIFEGDHVDPLQVYGASKLMGESFLRSQKVPGAIVVRTSGVYSHGGSRQKKSNFVNFVIDNLKSEKPISLPGDQISNLTNANHLAHALQALCHHVFCGGSSPSTLHIVGEGSSSWFNFAKHIGEEIGKAGLVKSRISEGKDERGFLRPLNSGIASKYKTELPFLRLPDWQSGIQDHLKTL